MSGSERSKPKSKGKSPPSKPAKVAASSAASVKTGDWRARALAEVRRLILEADPEIVEERKWVKASNPAGVPVWSHAGIVCTGETYKQVVKLTFAQGAKLPDPAGLFNSSLEGNARRAIDIHEGDEVDAKAFKALIKAAVMHNSSPTKKNPATISKARMSKASPNKAKPNKLQKNEQGVVLLSGGNPQIAKADGDAPVQAYIAAMPGWKSDLGRRLDELIVRTVPEVRKAVRWNSPFYGIEGQGWFLSFHVLTRYVKVTFFRGASLQPVPPGVGKDKDGRWIDIYETDPLDEAQMASWVRQAAAIPGWVP
jgi:hypothetical protein